jgi:histidinol-phosphate aminotransferase
MALSRRRFVSALGLGGAGAVALPGLLNARGLEAGNAEAWTQALAQGAAPIKLDSNENPNGPVPSAIRAVQESFRRAALYPARNEGPVRDAIAKASGLASDQVMLGCGSGEVLRLAVQAFCSATRPLVTAHPSFESPYQYATALGLPVREVPLDAAHRIDLEAMLARVPGAGLVFLCNPNNPTGHVHGEAAVSSFLERALRADPQVVILVDEAYHEFVTDPAYASAVAHVARHPRVFVSRTFSKIYGMAGMRLGYALGAPATLERMERLRLPNGIGGLTQVAGIAAIADQPRMRQEASQNAETRAFTTEWFTRKGFAVVPSQANFVLVDLRRDVAGFRDACTKEGVLVGRVFPPLTRHCRISVGTMDEMRRATRIFEKLLA